MRVALVVERLDPSRGGVEQWSWQFAQRLVARGVSLTLVTTEVAPTLRLPGAEVHYVPRGRHRLATGEAIEATLRRLPVDVIHDTGVGWYCDVFQPHGGSRVAAFERNLALAPRWLRPGKRLAARVLPRYREFAALNDRQYCADGRWVLALSQRVAADVARWHGFPAEQVRVVYNGVDLERFHPDVCRPLRGDMRSAWGLGDDDRLALIVAHNFALKGVATLIRAAAHLRAAGKRLHVAVVGSGRPGRYQRLAARLGVGPQVRFVGPQSSVVPCYAAADIYVQPTFYDPCSLVVLEAMACGLPVVTTTWNGVSELITPGVEGDVLSDPGGAQELAAMLAGLMEAERGAAVGAAARRTAERHSFERNCEEILALYGQRAGGAARAA